jgi:hypothetical protein
VSWAGCCFAPAGRRCWSARRHRVGETPEERVTLCVGRKRLRSSVAQHSKQGCCDAQSDRRPADFRRDDEKMTATRVVHRGSISSALPVCVCSASGQAAPLCFILRGKLSRVHTSSTAGQTYTRETFRCCTQHCKCTDGSSSSGDAPHSFPALSSECLCFAYCTRCSESCSLSKALFRRSRPRRCDVCVQPCSLSHHVFRS